MKGRYSYGIDERQDAMKVKSDLIDAVTVVR
jgi:hypothetical protein